MSLSGLDSASAHSTEAEQAMDLQGPAPVLGENAREWTELGNFANRREDIDDLIDKALNARLPRGRDLKPNEVDKLNPVHIEWIFMRACGIKQRKIAQLFDTSDSVVSVVLNHPDSRYLLGKLLSYAADEVIDIDTRLRAMRADAVDTLAQDLRFGKEETRTRIAFGILDRTGHGKEIKSKVTHEISVPKEAMDLLNEALGEADSIQDAEWTYVDAPIAPLALPHGSPIGSGGSVSGPQGPAIPETGDGVPPSVGSQLLDPPPQERVA